MVKDHSTSPGQETKRGRQEEGGGGSHALAGTSRAIGVGGRRRVLRCYGIWNVRGITQKIKDVRISNEGNWSYVMILEF